MKTNTIIKHTVTMISAIALFALPAHAVQNFNKTTSLTTGDSKFGAVATFSASDNLIKPSGSTLGSYAITASGSVTGKVLSKSITALSGTGTVKEMSNGTGTFSGNLSAVGISLVNVSNKSLPYNSPHFIKKWSASTSIPFTLFLIPFNVTAKVNASVDAFFRVDTTTTPSTFTGGIPRLDIKMGPVADLAASAEASVGVGISGIASLSVGASGSLKLGKAALTVNASVVPTLSLNTAVLQVAGAAVTPGAIAVRPVALVAPVGAFSARGAKATVSITADMAGITGSLDVFAQGELFLVGTKRATKNIASYSSGPKSVNLLGPIAYTWF